MIRVIGCAIDHSRLIFCCCLWFFDLRFIQARTMKRRGWKRHDKRWCNPNPFWIFLISATFFISTLNHLSAKHTQPSNSQTKNIINEFTNDAGKRAIVVKVNRTSKPLSVEIGDREYVYLTEDEANEVNKEDYYYYYEDEFYDDGEDLYHLEAPKANKTKEKDSKPELLNEVKTNQLEVVIDVGDGDGTRKERDSHLNHIFTHPAEDLFKPTPEVYSTGWVVIPHPPPPGGNYVHHSTTPAPHDLHVKHQHHLHQHGDTSNTPLSHPVENIHVIHPVSTTIGTITTTHHALPTPTQHLPFHNFPKYHKHQEAAQYVPKNVYVQDQFYEHPVEEHGVTKQPFLHSVPGVNEIKASTKLNVHPPNHNAINDSNRKEPKTRDHKVLEEVYHFHPLQPISTVVTPENNFLVSPTHPTPSYHPSTSTLSPITITAYPSYYKHPKDSLTHIHYNPYVKYPETTTKTTLNANANDRRPQRDYFPAPRIIGVLQDEGATTLLDLIEKANLTDVLNTRDAKFTIFAPTNDAFAKLDPNLVRTLTEDDGGDFDLLRSVLLYHVVPRKIYTRNFNDDTTLETALVIEADENTSAEENEEGSGDEDKKERKKEVKQLRVTKNDDNGVVTVNGAHVDIEKSDQSASNGVIHFVNDVIYPIPTGSIFETLSRDNRFSILVDLLEAAELASALNTSSADSLTIFAPTDDAFLKLPRSGLEEIVEDKKAVTDLLLNHVTMGTKLSPDLTFKTLKSLTRGSEIKLQVRKGQVYVGSAKLIDGDIMTTNGAIQVIDTVLL